MHIFWQNLTINLNPIQDGPFQGTHGWGGEPFGKKAPLIKICHTYPTMMKFGTLTSYLRKIQRLYKSRDTPLEFCWHQKFFVYVKKYRYRLYFDILFPKSFNFFLILKDFSNKHGRNFDDVSKNGYSRPS